MISYLLLACKIVDTPTPVKAPPSPVEAPASPSEAAGAGSAAKNAGSAAGALAERLKAPPPKVLSAVGVPHALIWAEPEIRHRTLGQLRQGQLVLVGEPGPKVRWRDHDTNLVQVSAEGREGWMIATDLHPQTLPVWATALGGPFDPFENPENLCRETAPKPWAGGEFRLVSEEKGGQVRYESACIAKAEDGTTTPSSRQGIAPATDFVLARETQTCAKQLESLQSRTAALEQAWPQDPSVCNLLKIEKVEPPFPDSETTWRIDLEGGDHPAEGFVVDGVWLATHLTQAKRIFDGPDYVLMAAEVNGTFQVLRLGTDPASVLNVLEKPMNGETFTTQEKGTVEGNKGSRCEWMPGRKQYYRCNGA